MKNVPQKKEDKKKSNLELFKEELKVMQQEREQRHAIKRARSSIGGNTPRRGGAGASSPPMRSSRFSNSDEVDDKLVAEFANDPSSMLLLTMLNLCFVTVDSGYSGLSREQQKLFTITESSLYLYLVNFWF